MALSVRRSILCENVVLLCCLLVLACFPTVPAFAQHPTSRAVGVPSPAPAPSAIHVPVYHAPIYQPPIYHSPGYASIYQPRTSQAQQAAIFLPPRRPTRPFPPAFLFYAFPVFNNPFWPFNLCWWETCDQFWTSTLTYNTALLDQWNPTNFAPPASEAAEYVYGADRPDIPQLLLTDGTILYVNDYWLVDGQLHFMIVEQDGTKPVEHAIPIDELDLQKTVDVNTQSGFRFTLRNEPFEQYVRDHPEGPPPALSPQ